MSCVFETLSETNTTGIGRDWNFFTPLLYSRLLERGWGLLRPVISSFHVYLSSIFKRRPLSNKREYNNKGIRKFQPLPIPASTSPFLSCNIYISVAFQIHKTLTIDESNMDLQITQN
jgi:hypothetical protein